MEEKKQMRKLILIICGVTAAILLVCLAIHIETDRLPEEPGVSVYYTFSDMTKGKHYQPLSAGGRAYGFAGRKIWISREEYARDAQDYWFKPYCKPLSIWTYSAKEAGICQFTVNEKGDLFYFSVKESGGAKASLITVKRWPLNVAGTDAVKESSWTGREDVTYQWEKGWLSGRSKGCFLAEPGYLYSIFVNWGLGWDEFSFSALPVRNAEGSLPDGTAE